MKKTSEFRIRTKFHSPEKLLLTMLHDFWREPSIYGQLRLSLYLFFTDAHRLGVRTSKP